MRNKLKETSKQVCNFIKIFECLHATGRFIDRTVSRLTKFN